MREPVRIVRFSCGEREEDGRRRAVTVRCFESVVVRIWRPVLPEPPRMRICISWRLVSWWWRSFDWDLGVLVNWI